MSPRLSGHRVRQRLTPLGRAGAAKDRVGTRTRVDIIDETFVVASPAVLAPLFHDPRNQSSWWPHLRLDLVRERGAKGAEWAIAGQIDGTMEVWLEPVWDGSVVHHYVRGVSGPAAPAGVATRHVLRWKAAITGVKDVVETPGSAPGRRTVTCAPWPIAPNPPCISPRIRTPSWTSSPMWSSIRSGLGRSRP